MRSFAHTFLERDIPDLGSRGPLEQVLAAHGDHEAYFYATHRGAELDLLLLRRGRRWGFNFKCADAPEPPAPCTSPPPT